MNVSLKNIDATKGIVKLEIVKADYADKVEKSLRSFRQKAEMPGFRKGMVPMGMVKKMYGMIMVPAVVRGRESGIQALALVTLDLESSGEHWGTTFLTPGGPLVQGHAELTEEQKRAIREYYIPYDYWYTPLVERDHHVNFTDMPETVADIRRLVDESLVTGQAQQMEGPK